MASGRIHLSKYLAFKRDALDEANSHPTRIDALFEAAFHLIEFCVSKFDIHINKHQNVRAVLEENADIFADETKAIWQAFQDIENKIRPGQAYGGKINGEEYGRAKGLFDLIESVCKRRGYLDTEGVR